MKHKKTIEYYLNLPWTYTLEQEIHKGTLYHIIKVNELPGVCTHNEDVNLGLQEIKDAIACAIELYIRQGEEIPEPIKKEEYKGKIAYRTTSERHYHLAKLAKHKHISMNKAMDMVFDAGIKSIERGTSQLGFF